MSGSNTLELLSERLLDIYYDKAYFTPYYLKKMLEYLIKKGLIAKLDNDYYIPKKVIFMKDEIISGLELLAAGILILDDLIPAIGQVDDIVAIGLVADGITRFKKKYVVVIDKKELKKRFLEELRKREGHINGWRM